MKLSALLEGLQTEILQGSPDIDIKEIIYDSRKVTPQTLFICVRGANVDGHSFAKDVAEKGAAALIVEEPVDVPENVTVIKVPDSRYAMALTAAAWYGHPADKLKTIGVTGTKGKTTTTYLVKSILENAGYKVGLIGTIETIIGEKTIPSANTTPESHLIQKYFAEMVEEGCDCVVMEVSSQGLMLHRTAGITFDFGIFTNIEPDHIGPNEHASFEEYLECKSRLLKQWARMDCPCLLTQCITLATTVRKTCWTLWIFCSRSWYVLACCLRIMTSKLIRSWCPCNQAMCL